MATYQEIVAGEIRAEMARQRRSQEDVALTLGWTQQYLSRRLTGLTALSTDDIEAIARALGAPLGNFVAPAARASETAS